LEFAFGHYVEMSSVTLIFANHRHKPVDLLGGFEAYSALLKEMQPHSHQERPTHGDIKPANIMFSPSQEAASAVLISEDGTVTEENRMGLPPQPLAWAKSHRRGRRPMRTSFANAEVPRVMGFGVCKRCSATSAEAASMVEFSPKVCVQHTCTTESLDWEPDDSINDYISWDRGLENSDWNSTELGPDGLASFRCDSCTLEKSSSGFTSLGNEDLDEAPY
jgi:serine/threonine protein kinase